MELRPRKHRLSRIAAALLLLPAAALAALGTLTPWSPSGWFSLGIVALVGIALTIAEARPRRGLLLIALALAGTLAVVRWIGTGSGMITLHTLPGDSGPRLLSRLLDEQDIAQGGARVLAARWHLPRNEREQLLPAMHDAYVEMRRDDVLAPSPVLSTLAGRQSPSAFDMLVIEPRAEPRPGVPMKFGVVFLHGFAGSYTLECWLVASAARTIGAVTVCPATDFTGHWRGDRGASIVRATIGYLHGRGIKRIFLAGLSNGAAGATALAPQLASEVSGLILISGAPSGGSTAGLPALVLHGSDDTIAPVSAARAFAAHNDATLTEFSGGHFVLLVRRTETRAALSNWLLHQSGYRE